MSLEFKPAKMDYFSAAKNLSDKLANLLHFIVDLETREEK